MSTKYISSIECLLQFGSIRKYLNLRATKALKAFGIGPKQAILIRALGDKESSLAELSRATQTDPAATGKAVDNLIKRGLLDQHPHPTDRRRWVVSLTKQGTSLHREVTKIWEQLADEMVAPLTREQRNSFGSLLKTISQSLEESPHGKTKRELRG